MEVAKINEVKLNLYLEPFSEFIYKFKGYSVHPSKCKVKIWRTKGVYLVLFIDLGFGTSVTNASEQLIEEMARHCYTNWGVKTENIFFAEGYEGKNEDIDLIIPTWKGNKVVDVYWKNVGKVDFLK